MKWKASPLYFLPQIHRDNSHPLVNINTMYLKSWNTFMILTPVLESTVLYIDGKQRNLKGAIEEQLSLMT